jgi:hypothetical protein
MSDGKECRHATCALLRKRVSNNDTDVQPHRSTAYSEKHHSYRRGLPIACRLVL